MSDNITELNIIPRKQRSKRLLALDAARGLAVVGMFVQHFALNQINSFVSGNTMILFILCSGISYSIMSQSMKEHGIEPTTFRSRVLARSVFIDFIGYLILMLNGPFWHGFVCLCNAVYSVACIGSLFCPYFDHSFRSTIFGESTTHVDWPKLICRYCLIR